MLNSDEYKPVTNVDEWFNSVEELTIVVPSFDKFLIVASNYEFDKSILMLVLLPSTIWNRRSRRKIT